MTVEDRIALEQKLIQQSYWLRALTAVMACLTFLATALLLWMSLSIQVGNHQILTTLTNAIEAGNKQAPAVIQQLENDMDTRSKSIQDKLDKLCKAQKVKC